jgi:hypothetical protein
MKPLLCFLDTLKPLNVMPSHLRGSPCKLFQILEFFKKFEMSLNLDKLSIILMLDLDLCATDNM